MTETLTLACGSFSPVDVMMILAYVFAPLVLAGLFTVAAIVVGVSSRGESGPGIVAVLAAWATALVTQFAVWMPMLRGH